MGFYQPHLISALDSLGIHVSNVIKLDLEREDQSEEGEETVAEENHHSSEDQGKLLRNFMLMPFKFYYIVHAEFARFGVGDVVVFVLKLAG